MEPVGQIVRMLCAGPIDGDLSEFNVLLGAHGPVIIYRPEAVDASANGMPFAFWRGDVENITAYCARSAPELRDTFFAHEMWTLYEQDELRADTVLTEFTFDATAVNVDEVLMQIEEARREIRQAGRGAAED